ncbi:MAG: LppX_LprAFG lipoprotein [Actinobacteria bacterium]|nr:MAG: LppX_LprAFG lipoprotein [Actinomycetota bacterium]
MVLLLALAQLGACGKSGSSPSALPQGLGLLQQSGQAMGSVSSAHVDLIFDGSLCCYIKSAQGEFYLKGPTGGWVSSAPPYDPTKLLDPTNGLPSILAKATAGTTQASESVGGVDAYRVAASIPTELIKTLTDLAPGQDNLNATVWIAASGNQLLKFRIPFRAQGASQDTVLTGSLTHFGVAVNVTPPV